MRKLNLCILAIFAALLFSSCQQDDFDTDNSSPLLTEKQKKGVKVCTFDFQNDFLNDQNTRAVIMKNRKWTSGTTIRVKFLNGNSFLRSKVRKYAKQWSKYANIKFKYVSSSADADIKIGFEWEGDTGSWSYLGTYCKEIPQNEPSMNFGWFDSKTEESEFRRTIVHEFGHALGLQHEHQHPLNEIKWNHTLLYNYYAEFGWTKEDVDYNVIGKLSTTYTNYSSYDNKSIMHYSIPKEHTTDGYSVGWNTQLSPTDKSFIAQEYPKCKSK